MLSVQELVPSRRHTGIRQEEGAIIVFVALGLVVLIGMMGLAFDLGHAYVNKSQLQNVADASALAGASALDGTADGIDRAETRATDYGSSQYLANRTEFNTELVPVPASAVTYASALDGPWLSKSSAQASAADMRYVRVIVPPRQTVVRLAKIVPGIPDSLVFGAEAVAGRMPLTKVCGGLDPFSPIRIPPGTPNYGYVIGETYMLRLAPGNSGLGTGCTGSLPPLPLGGSVTGNFGFADSGGCGPSLNCFRDNILGAPDSNCVAIEPNALPATTGDMGNAAVRAMQDRYEQDTDENPYPLYSDYLNGYLESTTRNNRRIIRVAFNNGDIPLGNSAPYNVVGFGCFFMTQPVSVSPPASAICLMFVGSCDVSGMPTGGNAPSITKVVLFR